MSNSISVPSASSSDPSPVSGLTPDAERDRLPLHPGRRELPRALELVLEPLLEVGQNAGARRADASPDQRLLDPAAQPAGLGCRLGEHARQAPQLFRSAAHQLHDVVS